MMMLQKSLHLFVAEKGFRCFFFSKNFNIRNSSLAKIISSTSLVKYSRWQLDMLLCEELSPFFFPFPYLTYILLIFVSLFAQKNKR